jgi:hypothetical protein
MTYRTINALLLLGVIRRSIEPQQIHRASEQVKRGKSKGGRP